MLLTYRRGDWKPSRWSFRTWVLACFAGILAFPFVVRWCCLWQIPDVRLPFDADEVILDDIPATENAFTSYASLGKSFNMLETAWSSQALGDVVENSEAKWDDRLDEWLIKCGSILDEFRRTSDIEKARGVSLRTIHFHTLIQPLMDIRHLVRLAQVEARREERLGNFDGAWLLHRACLRTAHHAETYRILMAAAFGARLRRYACDGIIHWASYPDVSIDQLQNARKEVDQFFSTHLPYSVFVKSDYILIRNTLSRFDGLDMLFPDWALSGRMNAPFLAFKHLELWIIGQPELSLRLCRQLLANHVKQFDLPLHLRQQTFAEQNGLVFDLDPNEKRLPGQLQPAELNEHMRSSLARLLREADVFSRVALMDTVVRGGKAKELTTRIALACHEYQRRSGEFPEDLQQLVPDYLDEVPIDPMDATGATFRYRRMASTEAIVWSVGRGGTDELGAIDGNDPKDIGYHIVLTNQAPAATKTD